MTFQIIPDPTTIMPKQEELIFLGYFSFNNPLPSVSQSTERMGINIIENNLLNTTKYWDYDTCIKYGLVDGLYNPVTQKCESD
jgi:hypothetical protein